MPSTSVLLRPVDLRFVTPSDTQGRDGARRLLAGLKPLAPQLELIWADGAYSGRDLARWCEK